MQANAFGRNETPGVAWHSDVRVLLIEDDAEDCLVTQNRLHDFLSTTAQIQWSRTVDSGMAEILLEDYDVCLIDYRLGKANGLDFIRRAVAAGCRTPMILISSIADTELKAKATRAGAFDCLAKPFPNLQEFESSIRSAVEYCRAQKALMIVPVSGCPPAWY